jgi:hypothetical protein
MGAVLGSVLPGLRQIRAPLAAGFLWLFVFWIGFWRDVRFDELSSGLAGDVYRLLQAFGVGSVLAATTFVAYLVGTLAQPLGWLFAAPYALGHRFNELQYQSPLKNVAPEGEEPLPSSADSPFADLARLMIETLESRFAADDRARLEAVERIKGLASGPFRLSYMLPHSGFVGDVTADEAATAVMGPEGGSQNIRLGMIILLVHVEDYWRRLVDDFTETVPHRLLGKEPEVYANFDRYVAEYEFRRAVAGPLYLLFGVLAFQISFFWIFGWLGCFTLTRLAYGARRDGYIQLTQSLHAGRVESPVLTEIKNGPLLWREPEAARDFVSRLAERVFYKSRPSWRSMVPLDLVGLLAATIVGVGVALATDVLRGILGLGVVLAAVTLFSLIRCFSTVYTITNREMAIRHGSSIRRASSSYAQGVKIRHSVVQRILHIATADIETSNGWNFSFVGVRNPDKVVSGVKDARAAAGLDH